MKIHKVFLIVIISALFGACEDEPPISVMAGSGYSSIEATIIDQDNDLIPGASVKIINENLEYISDSLGKIYTSSIRTGVYTIAVWKENYADTSYSVEALKSGKTEVTLSLFIKGSIEGNVINPADKQPVANTKITTTPETGEYFSDAEGNFVIPYLEAGAYNLKLSDTDITSIADIEKQVNVVNGYNTEVQFGEVIKGHINSLITDQDNNPVENASVILMPGDLNLISGSDGYFESGYLEAGEYEILISKENYVDSSYIVQVEDDIEINESFTILIKGSIAGNITDSYGVPMKDVLVSTDPPTMEVYSDDAGNYMLEYLEEGSYKVIAQINGYCDDVKYITVGNTLTADCDLNLYNSILYEGQTYNMVQIGEQCWLKENLNIGEMIHSGSEAANNGLIEKYCYGNNPENCEIYGGLYGWNEAMNYKIDIEGAQGICPEGWHMPKHEDWYVLASSAEWNGNNLKSVGLSGGNGTGTNTTGFSALLGGYRFGWDYFNQDWYGFFWGSLKIGSGNSSAIRLKYCDENIAIGDQPRYLGLSVRCIRDEITP